MGISIIVGGQFGSEGKGKVASFWAEKNNAQAMVRCGGSNSGHTVIHNGETIVFRHLPSGALNTDCRLLIPAGGYIVPKILMKEISDHKINPNRVGIDPNAVIVEDRHITCEEKSDLKDQIGSTLSGMGAAVMDRVSRSKTVVLAKDRSDLKPFIADVAKEVKEISQKGGNVVIEGSQGFGLSLYHAYDYPYATSRDTTAAAFASEVGISPLDITEVIMVIRAFPIRVGGNSGPLPQEISWDDIKAISGSEDDIKEYTSVTGRLRRVAEFDARVVKRAIMINQPSHIVLNHVDYWDQAVYSNKTAIKTDIITSHIKEIETSIEQKIDWVGIGPQNQDLFYWR